MNLVWSFIVANIGIVGFNAIGMGIMTFQLDDFYAGKRDDIYGPPNWRVYVLMWLAMFLITYVFLSVS